MASQRRAGIKQVSIDGVVQDAKGNWSYDLGGEKRDPIEGADRVHGFKVTRKVAFVEGAITDRNGLDVKALKKLDDSTITLELENGKVIKFGHAWYAAEGKVTTDEAEIEIRFECDPDNAEEI